MIIPRFSFFHSLGSTIAFAFLFFFGVQAEAAENISLKLEIGRALDKGVTWLNNEQNSTSGHWGESEYPALTGLALRATMGHPDSTLVGKFSKNRRRASSSCCPKSIRRWYLRHGFSLLQYLHLHDGPDATKESKYEVNSP